MAMGRSWDWRKGLARGCRRRPRRTDKAEAVAVSSNLLWLFSSRQVSTTTKEKISRGEFANLVKERREEKGQRGQRKVEVRFVWVENV